MTVIVEYGSSQPTDFLYRAASKATIIPGTFASIYDDKTLDLYDGSLPVFGYFVQDADDITSPDLMIEFVTNFAIIKTNVFVGVVGAYSPGCLIYADNTTGKITAVAGADHALVGRCVAVDATYVTFALDIPVATGDLLVETDESVTVGTASGVLSHIPLAVYTAYSATPANLTQVSNTATLATLQYKVDYTTGKLTFFSGDVATPILVTYLRRA